MLNVQVIWQAQKRKEVNLGLVLHGYKLCTNYIISSGLNGCKCSFKVAFAPLHSEGDNT